MSTLLKTEELCDWLGCKQPARLRRLLLERNISFTTDGAGNPITTLDMINDSLKGKQDSQEVDF